MRLRINGSIRAHAASPAVERVTHADSRDHQHRPGRPANIRRPAGAASAATSHRVCADDRIRHVATSA